MNQKKLRRLLDFQIHLWTLKQIELARDSGIQEEEEDANEILRGKLWIGNAVAATAPEFDAIVSVVGKPLKDIHSDGVSYFRIIADDAPETNLKRWFDDVGAFIHYHIVERGHCVLIHCMAGHSRSATLCIAYLIKYLSLDFYGAYMVVKSSRPTVSPNESFIKQLLQYDQEQRQQRK
jgi:hypothetical protein